MKNKIIGLIIVAISLLFHGINISLANIAQNSDIPESVVFINVISVLIGIYIMFSTDEKDMFKRIIESVKNMK
ncbi:MAG TPA: hypothetical protein VIK86_08975 [Candidatus Paceibacterota bacterium]